MSDPAESNEYIIVICVHILRKNRTSVHWPIYAEWGGIITYERWEIMHEAVFIDN